MDNEFGRYADAIIYDLQSSNFIMIWQILNG